MTLCLQTMSSILLVLSCGLTGVLPAATGRGEARLEAGQALLLQALHSTRGSSPEGSARSWGGALCERVVRGLLKARQDWQGAIYAGVQLGHRIPEPSQAFRYAGGRDKKEICP